MNWQKYLTALTLGVFVLTAPLTGCGIMQKITGGGGKKQTSQKGGQPSAKPKIAVILSEQEESPQIKRGLMDAAKKENAQLVFIKDPQKELQKKGKDAKALIIQGGEQQAAAMSSVTTKQNMPIVTIEILEGVKADAVVAPNYTKIGEIQADFLKNKLKQGNVVVLQGEDPGSEEVVSAIKAALVHSPEIKLAQTFTSPRKGMSPVSNFSDYLNQNAGKVQAVVVTDSKLGLEVVETLKKTEQEKKIMVVGAGTHKQALEKVASGELSADVDKSPYLQGMFSFKLASQLMKKETADADSTVTTDTGETPAKLVPVRLVVPENLAQFQKAYNQPTPQEEEQGDQEKQEGDKEKDGKQTSQGGKEDKDSQSSEEKDKKQGQDGQQGQKKPMPAGVTQVREKIRTEIEREMLGQDGKVMGTEKETKEEVRTLPAALVQARQEQQKQDQKDKESKDKQDSDKKDSGDSEDSSQ